MQHDPNPEIPTSTGPAGAGQLAPADVVQLLHLMGTLGSLRNDPRAWRLELLAGLNRLLPAAASVAMILRQARSAAPEITGLFDAGFQSSAQRQAFLREMNHAPLLDPLSVFALRRFIAQEGGTHTFLRSDVLDDAAWNAHLHVLTHRRATGMEDCLLSIQPGDQPGVAYVILILRSAVSRPAEGAAPGKNPPPRLGPREKLLLDTLHRGLDWIYRIEESTQRLDQASALSPRVRETLAFLLAGDTERQIAAKMSISVHTVHGYIKTIYVHFGVSSRRELMARWIGEGGHPPQRDKK